MKLFHRNYLVLIILILVSCKSADTVSFKTPVDTTTKPIKSQKKQMFALDDLGIYASNEFDGARLNGLKKVNDSTAILLINPENEPINNSAYYAFRIWSKTPKSFYLKFQYPKGYKHRYAPKLKKDKNWFIIDSTNLFKKDSLVTIKLKLDKSPLTVAAQQINSSSDVKSWYTNLIKGKEDYVHFSNFGKSTLGRNLPVLDIYKGDKKNKDIIVLLTRQHPPEVTGYFAFQEFLKTILTLSCPAKSCK